ncbi:MAG: PBECR4 domain-containing protein [Lactobacillus crispatus]|nr:PBECR4 domain-containing protein [Lactobacillus crispatus]
MTFKYIKSNNNFKMRSIDRLANIEDVKSINEYIHDIQKVAKFYKDKLAKGQIDYIYRKNQTIEMLPVKFKVENFAHLTGIKFGSASAKKEFINLLKGTNTEPIIVERQNRTIDKLKVLKKLPNILEISATTLTSLQEAEQAQKLGFSRAIKNSDNDLLIALQNFKPEFYQPRSLLNLTKIDEYQNVPENTILGIFQEGKDRVRYADENNKKHQINLGHGAGAIAINHEYIKTPLDAMSLAMVVNKNLALSTVIKNKNQVPELNKEKSNAKKLTVKVDPRAREIALRRMRDQGLER